MGKWTKLADNLRQQDRRADSRNKDIPQMSEDLPKQELIRKVNSTMASFGWDWDKLIAGKIKVVADPFGKQVQNGNPNPYESRTGRRAPPPPPPPPAPRARPRPTPPPPP